MSKFIPSCKSTPCKSMLLLIMGATFFTLTTISSTQKNFHPPPIDLPHQTQHQTPQYTAELAAKAVEPTVWTCGEEDREKRDVIDPVTNQRPFFAFVHVYKTGGTTVREFFKQYATICNKSLALVEKCQFQAERVGIEKVDIEKCKFLDSKSVNAPRGIDNVNSTILHDHYDILGGHFTFGMADDIFSNAEATSSDDTSQVRHMVFLRQPMTKHVSHVLYKQKQGKRDKFDTLEETVKDIKDRVRSFRENGEYVGSLHFPQAPGVQTYLLTPEQRKMTDNRQEQTVEEMMALKTQLAIDNLMQYNAIVGITEMVPQSIQIFEHALGQIVSSARKKQEVQDFFSKYTSERELQAKNRSNRGDISTGSVLKELKKDEEFMTIFREFVKFEELIYKTALDMHEKQYEAVKKGHFERYTWEESLDGSKASR